MRFKPAKDSLMRAATRTRYPGSSKTRVAHLKEVNQFVKELRNQGLGVKKWDNVTNKHIGAVVKSWQDRGLETKTIKEYLSGVRATAEANGNNSIHKDNSAFGLENIKYVKNIDKSMHDAKLTSIMKNLKAGGNHEIRVAAQLGLCRHLGLRHEEARKFNPSRDVLPDGRVHVAAGAKGGKERVLSEISPEGRNAIENARSVAGTGSMIPPDMRDSQWEKKGYKILEKAGANKKYEKFHSARHAYAQLRYEQLTGFKCRVKYESKEAFAQAAIEARGEDWKDYDKSARGIIKVEMGHGLGRDSTVAQYLGSNSK